MVFRAEWGKVWSLSWQGWTLLAGAGIIHFLVGRFLNYTSIRLIGANKATAIARTSILYSVTFGVVLLNELLTIPLVLGILGIAGGVTLISIEKEGVGTKKQSGPAKVPVRGILSGLSAGLCWAISAVLMKLGVTEIGSPFAAAFVSYLSTFLILAGLLSGKRQQEQLFKFHRSSLIPLSIAAVFTSGAQLFRFAALFHSPVSIVQPLLSTNVLYVLLFSFLLNRKIEVFTWKVIMGIVVTAAGSFLLAS